MAPYFSFLGIPPATGPNVTSPTGYSSPTIRLPSGGFVVDSRNIADALEQLQPEPSLRLHSSYVERVQDAVLSVGKALAPIAIPRVPEMLLNPESEEYFRRTRRGRFDGIELVDLARSERAGEAAWEGAEGGWKDLVAILGENGGGPFVLGEEASYADFVLAGLWAFFKKLDKDGDLFGRVMGVDEAFGKHWEACQPWLERDDH
jgi:glutathione S-transferase